MANKQIIAGYLGKDPDVRYAQNGNAITTVSVATNYVYISNGEKKTETEWHKVVFFGRNAENAGKILQKGSLIYTEGRTKTNVWEKDGVKQYTKEVVGDFFELLSSKNDNMSGSTGNQGGGYQNRQMNNQGGNRGGYQNQNQGGGYQNQNQGGGYQNNFGSGGSNDDIPF